MALKLKKDNTKTTASNPKKKKSDATSTIIIILVLMAAVTVGVKFMDVAKTKLPQVQVIVAAQNIPADTVITESMLKNDLRYTDDVMKLSPTENIATAAKDIVGKRTCAPIYVGELINKHRIVENTAAMQANEAQLREVSIPYLSDDLGLKMRGGDFVDVWKVPTNEGILNGQVPEKILDNVEVIAIATADGFDISDVDPAQLTSDTYQAPGYYTLYLTEAQMNSLYNINSKSFNVKVAVHTPNSVYLDRIAAQDKLNGQQSTGPVVMDLNQNQNNVPEEGE